MGFLLHRSRRDSTAAASLDLADVAAGILADRFGGVFY